jgi:archaellum component FlaG (FlaF/FlaG flagellin family)
LFGFTTIYKDALIKRNSVHNSMSSQPISLLITTDKQSYNLSETVNITIKNVGNDSLTFSDSALGLRIKNLNTGEIYRLVAAQVLTELNSNESKSLKWKQEDNDGEQIKPGDFEASVTSGPLSANTTFKIK